MTLQLDRNVQLQHVERCQRPVGFARHMLKGATSELAAAKRLLEVPDV